MPISKILRGPVGILGYAVAAVSIAVTVVLHFNPLCGEETVLEKMSPDGKYVAVLMTRTCGATTSYVTILICAPRPQIFGQCFSTAPSKMEKSLRARNTVETAFAGPRLTNYL
jgi:hypothetical protein